MQLPMLKSVVQQVQPRPKLLLRNQSGMISALSDDHRNVERARDQQRLVAEIAHRSHRIDYMDAFTRTPVTSRQNIKADPALFQMLAKIDDERRLPCPADRYISYAYDWTVQLRGKPSRVVNEISRSNNRAVNKRERVHCSAPMSPIRAEAVRAVAPRCDSSTFRALSPRFCRLDSSASNSRSFGSNSALLPCSAVVRATVTASSRTKIAMMSRKLCV